MRIPKNRKKQYEKRMVALCSEDDDRRDLLLDTVERINRITEEQPFIKPKETKEAVVKYLMKQGVGDMEALRLYNAARNQMIPFFASGEKLAQADAQLDSIAREAQKNLYKDKYVATKEGPVLVGKEFDSNSASVVIKAVKGKMDTLLKAQSNVISAQRKEEEMSDKKEFTIEDADREQLERLVAGDLMDHSDLVDKLLNQGQDDDVIPAFYEVIDNG